MKKYLYIIATAALFASCAEKDSFKEIVSSDVEIGFSTFTGKLTRAENSSATSKNSLETYQTSFKVWSSKYIGETPTVVFTAQKVNAVLTTAATYYSAAEAKSYNSELDGALSATDALTAEQAANYNAAIQPETDKAENDALSAEEAASYNATLAGAVSEGDLKTPAVYDWKYSPIVFWDKSATKYDFYAAAPADLNWEWDNTNKKLSLDNFSVDGTSIDASSSIDAKAVFGVKDIMISEDITNHTTYTSTKVNLSFIHILSRLNIGVKKATPILDDFIVKLKSVKVYNMKSNGKFNENAATANNTTGNNSRWIDPCNTKTYFTDGVGYATETEITDEYNYVYQALAIPQTIEYEAGILLNGSNVSESSKPYLKIAYEIWTKPVLYKDTDTDIPNDKNVGDVRTPSAQTGAYNYTYNLADLFNGDGQTTSVAFNEGWMNTLKITINPEAIEFDADVYEWDPKAPVEVDVPDANPGN